MTLAHKQFAPLLARLRVLPPHCAMLPALALIVACSAGVPTGVDTSLNPADAPVVVNPRSLILEANQVSVFKAYAHGVPGDSLVTSIEWTATGGSIALDGTYSSPSTGDFKVVGKRHGPNRTTSDTATVTVVAPQPSITSVVISPDPATVTEQTQLTFSAVGKLSDGSTVAIGVTWTATGGTIDAGGVYTAGSTVGTYQVIAKAASANVADTVPISVTIPQPVGPDYPNLPAGYTIPAGYVDNFTNSSLTEGIFHVSQATVYQRDASTYNPVGATPPRGAPASPNLVGEVQYPAGFVSGYAPGIVGSNDFTANGWTHLYVTYTLQLSSNWQPQGAGIDKVGYAYAGTGANARCVFMWYYGRWAISVQGGTGPNGNRQQPANLGAPIGGWTPGSWQRIENEIILNDPGVANGIARAWMTNYDSKGQIISGPTKILEYTDVAWINTGEAKAWERANWNPIWGGGGSVVSQTMYMWMDRMAIGGR